MEEYKEYTGIETDFDQTFEGTNNISLLRDVQSMVDMTTDKEIFCEHLNIQKIDDVEICSDCGTEIIRDVSSTPDWRYYGENDNRYTSDPSRCHLRKNEERNIFKDISKLKIPKNISEYANDMYIKITDGKIRRGNFRKSLIFACVFLSYKQFGDPQMPDELRFKFGLTKKEISKGLNYVNLQTDKTKRLSYTSPSSYIVKLMNRFNASSKQIEEVEKLFNLTQNKSYLINRSNPLSVISGLIFYYFRSINKNISCSRFSEVVKLSEITILKIAKTISEILDTKTTVKLN